ncbi:hypothetical protein ACET3Z_005292 [Daucus carota]
MTRTWRASHVAPGPGAMVQFQAVFDNLSDEDSVHTNDMYVNAPPGTLTRLRQDFAIMDAGGTIRDHSHTQSESSSSVGVSIENHPEIIKANRSKLDYVNFLMSKGLLDDFNAYQSNLSNLHARNVDENGVIRPTLTSVARDFCVRQGILCVGNTNPDVGSSAPVAPKDAKTCLCACYGHSLARCTKNPNKVKDPSSDKGSTRAPPAHHGAPNSDIPKGTTRAPHEHTELQQPLAQTENENVQLDDVEMIQHMADIITDLARDMAYTQVEHTTPDSVQTPVLENAPVAPVGILESVPLDDAFADQEQINSPNRFQALADVDDDVMIDNTGIQNSHAHGPNVVVFGLAAPGGAMALPPLPPALEEGEFTPASKGKKKQRSKVQQASPSKRGLGNGDKGSTLPKRSRRLQGDATKASQ